MSDTALSIESPVVRVEAQMVRWIFEGLGAAAVPPRQYTFRVIPAPRDDQGLRIRGKLT